MPCLKRPSQVVPWHRVSQHAPAPSTPPLPTSSGAYLERAMAEACLDAVQRLRARVEPYLEVGVDAPDVGVLDGRSKSLGR
jgi:hypothetical protein